MSIIVLIVCFAVLIVIGTPIAVSLGVPVLISEALFSPTPLPLIGQQIFAHLDTSSMMSVPFFFLAAALMERSGIVKYLVTFANSLVGHFPGGMGMTAILSCCLFAAMCGSSAATVAVIGGIMFPALVKEGYSKSYAIGALATAGSVGILLPPSIPLILYGVVTETSVAKLFMAGIVPGLCYGLAMMVMAKRLAVREDYTPSAQTSNAERWMAFRQALPAIGLPAFLVVGIYGLPAFEAFGVSYDGGAIFTPTEAALVLVLLALVVGGLIYRGLTPGSVLSTTIATLPRVGMIFWIVTNALLFGFFLTKEGVPTAIADWLVSIEMPRWMFLLIVNLVLIVIGCFLDGVATILLFIPVLFPAARALGVDPLHFGVMIIVNIELALVTPPVGLNLYVGSAISGMPIHSVFKACLPWILVDLFILVLVTYVPELSTFLPGLME